MRTIKKYIKGYEIFYCTFDDSVNDSKIYDNGLYCNIPGSERKHLIGYVIFTRDAEQKQFFYAVDVHVEERFRRQRIATSMYDVAATQLKIRPSKFHTKDGAKFWEQRKYKLDISNQVI